MLVHAMFNESNLKYKPTNTTLSTLTGSLKDLLVITHVKVYRKYLLKATVMARRRLMQYAHCHEGN